MVAILIYKIFGFHDQLYQLMLISRIGGDTGDKSSILTPPHHNEAPQGGVKHDG